MSNPISKVRGSSSSSGVVWCDVRMSIASISRRCWGVSEPISNVPTVNTIISNRFMKYDV